MGGLADRRPRPGRPRAITIEVDLRQFSGDAHHIVGVEVLLLDDARP